MTPQILIIIASDPRTSARPAEAIRIAAGVGTWKKARFAVYLAGPAVLSLSEWADEYVDEDNFDHYLPILADFELPVMVESGSPHLAELGEPRLPFRETTPQELQRVAASSNYVMRF